MSVGLDIGSRTIKVVELNRDGSGFALKSAGVVGYTSDGTIDKLSDDKHFSNLSQVVKKLLHDAKISSKNVTLSIPETQVFTRIMKFPLLNDQEIASAVKWEAEEYIPIPVKDSIIQHQVLERREVGNPPQVLVLLVAVLRELVEKYIKIANLAGLNVVSVETELMSLVRSITTGTNTSMVIDFGADSTDLALAKGDQLFFSRSIPTAGNAFTRAVSQALGVSSEQAEQYKSTYGLSPEHLEGKVGAALTPIIRVVVEEIKKSIHYFQIETKLDPPSTIYLTGGTAGLPEIAPYFTKLLNTEVIIANPFTKVKVDTKYAKELTGYAPLYAVAVGLAMRGG